MKSSKIITWLNAAALVALGLFFVFAVFGALVGTSGGWPEYISAGAVALFAGLAALLRIKQRAELHRSAKASRDSLLKHIWELRHRREW